MLNKLYFQYFISVQPHFHMTISDHILPHFWCNIKQHVLARLMLK